MTHQEALDLSAEFLQKARGAVSDEGFECLDLCDVHCNEAAPTAKEVEALSKVLEEAVWATTMKTLS
jgi:hypothetical protein